MTTKYQEAVDGEEYKLRVEQMKDYLERIVHAEVACGFRCQRCWMHPDACECEEGYSMEVL